jgi:hypothetical protein
LVAINLLLFIDAVPNPALFLNGRLGILPSWPS